MSCGVGCCLITRSVRVATVEQALAMTRRWLTNHSGYCLGNSSSSPPSPPAPAHNGQSLSTWWSSKYNDNAICIRGGVNCDKAAAARSLDTNTVAAKHHSAKADVHFGDCCPLPMHQKDGLAPPVLDPAYKFMRTESYLMPTHAEIAVAAGITLVELQMVYSKANQDNFLGTANASALPGYNAVVGCSVDEQYNLSAIPARIFAEPPNASLCICGAWYHVSVAEAVLRVTCMYVHSCTHVSSPLRTIDTIPSTVDPRLISFAWTRLRRGASVSTHCTTVLSRF
jgi:hypothetical protein